MFERTRTRVNGDFTKSIGVGALGYGAIIVKDIDGTRDIAPEPFDVFDHAGNVFYSTQIAFWGGLLLGKALAERANNKGESIDGNMLKAKIIAAGFTVAVALNTLAETRYGMKILGFGDTADPVDFAYGVIAGTAATALLTDVEEQVVQQYVPPEPFPDELA